MTSWPLAKAALRLPLRTEFASPATAAMSFRWVPKAAAPPAEAGFRSCMFGSQTFVNHSHEMVNLIISSVNNVGTVCPYSLLKVQRLLNRV